MNVSEAMTNTDLAQTPPNDEPLRQYFFIEKTAALLEKRSADLGRPLTYCVKTFGCQMNARDSEKLSGILQEMGYLPSASEEADLVLYNTCTVRENANNKIYGRLGYLHGYKKKNPDMIIALCGCMMQEEAVIEKLKKSYCFVDLIFGTYNIYKLAELIYRVLTTNEPVTDIAQSPGQIVESLPNRRKYSFKTGVNITFGCNNFCSYCIVPYVRGPERSRKPDEIIREVEGFASDGVKEIMLLGQNVNSYGRGLDVKITFSDLLKELEKIDGIERIRFMTPHPKDFPDELIETMALSEKICDHIHLPLQSGSSRILKLMNRSYTKEDYLLLVEKIRRALPYAALTTDIIVGFPGESEQDFEDTMDVVRQVRYDSAFTFIYSKRTGTKAASMPDQVPCEVSSERFKRLLDETQRSAAMRAAALTGKIREVLVEEINRQDQSFVTGRLSNNSVVHLPGGPKLIGQIIPVRLTESRGFYYMGEQVSLT